VGNFIVAVPPTDVLVGTSFWSREHPSPGLRPPSPLALARGEGRGLGEGCRR
jgi:hypothetical protein